MQPNVIDDWFPGELAHAINLLMNTVCFQQINLGMDIGKTEWRKESMYSHLLIVSKDMD